MRGVHAAELEFDELREEFKLPAGFPEDAVAQAVTAVDTKAAERTDRRDIPFVTIDPPGSMDLDQAVYVVPTATGFLLHYAIADVAAFVPIGSPLDVEARRRSQTMYVPDGAVPLHPVQLSEGAASLLPDQDRPAVLWTIETDAAGVITRGSVERALVRSTARLDYAQVQGWVDAGTPLPEAITGLEAFGRARQALALARGAVELQLPAQEIARDANGEWTVRLEARTAVDAWNAECSLTTGHVAASLMLQGGVGILRTLRAATPESEAEFRAAAVALGLEWTPGTSAGTFLASLPRGDVRTLALNTAATRLLRGADYCVFDGTLPATEDQWHAGVGDVYAHATAPLRRLVDRFVAECCLAIATGRPVPDEVRAALPEVRERMNATNRTASALERAALDMGEAVVLQSRVGERFTVAVTRAARPAAAGGRAKPAEVFLLDPPVFTACEGNPAAGTSIDAELVEADPARRSVTFREVSEEASAHAAVTTDTTAAARSADEGTS